MDYYETGLLELTAVDWFSIPGRGPVASIVNDPPQIPESLDLGDMLGMNVMIDGKRYKVRGVERAGYSRRNFGLLVREL